MGASNIPFGWGVAISIASSLLNSIRPPLQKHLGQKIRHPLLQQTLKGLVQVPIHVLIVILAENVFFPKSLVFYAAVIGNAFLNFAAESLMAYAYRMAPLSHTVPFTTLSLPFLVVTSSLILGEHPSMQGVIGVLTMCGGAFYLNSISAQKKSTSKKDNSSASERPNDDTNDVDLLDDDASKAQLEVTSLRRRKKPDSGNDNAEAKQAQNSAQSSKIKIQYEKQTATSVRKGSLLALCVAGLWSIASPIDKVAMRHGSPMHFTLYNTAAKNVINIVLLQVYRASASKEDKAVQMQILPGAWIFVVLSAVVGSMGYCMHALGSNSIPVVYNSALRRCSMIVSILYGAVVFKEHNLTKTLLASVIMISGVMLIITQPKS